MPNKTESNSDLLSNDSNHHIAYNFHDEIGWDKIGGRKPKSCFHYGCIAKGSYIIGDYTSIQEGEDDLLASVSRRALVKLPKTVGRKSYVFENHLFHFLVDNDGVYMCVCGQDIGPDLPWKFLTELRSAYKQECIRQSADQPLVALSTRLLIQLIEKYNKGEGGGSQKVEKVERELAAVTELVRENINKVLERSEQIESLVGKASNLKDESYSFRKDSKTLYQHVWWSKAKHYFIAGAMLLGVLFLIASLVCGGFTFQGCFA